MQPRPAHRLMQPSNTRIYNGENTNLYFYTNALNKVEVEYVSISSEGKYCYDTPEYKFGYNFVICNNTQQDINIGYIEFWC